MILFTALLLTASIDVGRGPVEVVIPSSVGPAPLVLLLHGGCSTGQIMSDYMRLTELDAYYQISPDGRFAIWPCHTWTSINEYEPGNIAYNDSAYLRALIIEAQAQFPITEVIVIGYSAGGNMAGPAPRRFCQ